jgi:hypothetical protein
MAKIEKQGVAWDRKFKNGKEGIKISINKEIYVAYKNTQKQKDTDPDYVIIRFIDE